MVDPRGWQGHSSPPANWPNGRLVAFLIPSGKSWIHRWKWISFCARLVSGKISSILALKQLDDLWIYSSRQRNKICWDLWSTTSECCLLPLSPKSARYFENNCSCMTFMWRETHMTPTWRSPFLESIPRWCSPESELFSSDSVLFFSVLFCSFCLKVESSHS